MGIVHRFRESTTVSTGLARVRKKSGKNNFFLQVGELSGNFEKMSGNFGHLTNVMELSGNFVMKIKFFLKMISFLLHTFSSPKIFVSLA